MPSDKSIEARFILEMWSFADHLRGKMSIGEYKDHFLTMFFFKYISDQYNKEYKGKKEFLQLYQEESGSIKTTLHHARFVIPDNNDFDYVAERKEDPNIGNVINKVLANISRANNKLYGIFYNVDFNDERVLGKPDENPYFLRKLISLLNGFNFASAENSDNHVQNIWTYLQENFFNQDKSEYLTPKAVCDLFAKLMQPKAQETIYDPACGSGNLLIRMFKETEEDGDAKNIFGQEINRNISVIARMNMFIHKMDCAKIECGDSINHPMFIQEIGTPLLDKFDVVISNPPFSVNDWWKGGEDKFNRFEWGMPPEKKGDYAFILHMLASTKELRGRMGMITSHGTLFRKGSELDIRKKIIDHNLLEAVIGLPTNLFSYTNIPTAILLFKKGRGNNSNILFIDASQDFEQDKRKNTLSEVNIKRIAATYEAFKAGPSGTSQAVEQGYSYIATHEEIKKNDYNINIARYVISEDQEQEIDVNQLKSEIDILDKKIADIDNKMQKYLRDLGL